MCSSSPHIYTGRCPHNKNKKQKLPCFHLFSFFCVACISAPDKLYCSSALDTSAFLGENQFFFSYIFYFCLKIKKGTVGGVAGIYQSADLYSSILLCFTSALLYPAVGRVNIFFIFLKTLLVWSCILEGRERAVYLQPSVGQEKAEPIWKKKKRGNCSSMRTCRYT
jgi:hypothetical protein